MIVYINDPVALLQRVGLDVRSSPLFDTAWYAQAYGDVSADPFEHFVQIGLRENRNPNAYFDSSWYYLRNPDVKRSGTNAFIHYVEHGSKEGRDPGPWFSTRRYLAFNPDVEAAGLDPLLHYLEFGRLEGRTPIAVTAPPSRNSSL